MKKIIFIFMIILSLFILVVGCSSSDSDNYTDDSTLGLKVVVNISDDLISQNIKTQRVEDHINLEKINFYLYLEGEDNNSPIDTKTLNNLTGDLKVAFDEVVVGEKYTVKVEGLGELPSETELKTLYRGVKTSEEVVSTDSITTVRITAKPLPAESIKVEFDSIPDNYTINNVILEHPSKKQKVTKNYTEVSSVIFNNNEDTDDGNQLELTPARWDILVEIESKDKERYEFLLLPAQNKNLILDIIEKGDGTIEVITSVQGSPTAPTGLELNENENLVWDYKSGVDVYRVYRSQSKTYEVSYLETVYTNKYEQPQEGYYYWVRAYKGGYSSGLSEPYYVGDTEEGGSGDEDDETDEANGEIVKFEDPNVEFAVRDKINKPSGDLTQKDVSSILTLYIRGNIDYSGTIEEDVKSLEGLEHLNNLQQLTINSFDLDNINPLKDLEKLKSLNLFLGNLNNLNVINKLNSLKALNLNGTSIKEITLEGLSELIILNIRSYNNQSVKLEQINLSNLPKLKELSLANNNLTEIVIPDSVTTISDRAFFGNDIKEIVIPDNVTTIGDSAFRDNNLTKLELGNSVETISDGAFSGNDIKEIVIPNNVTTIGDRAFRDNNLAKIKIGNNVDFIIDGWNSSFDGNFGTIYQDYYKFEGTYTKNGEEWDVEIIIPDDLETIDYRAFYDNNLVSVQIGKNVTTIGDQAFRDNNLSKIELENSVKIIGNNAFSGNDLTEIVIPDSVTTIGNSAFNFNDLTSIKIGDSVKTIGDSAFYSNDLAKVVIPDNVTTIGDSAFRFNDLTSIKIGDNVTTIGNNAFSVNDLTEIVIPDSVNEIGNRAFRDNDLTKIKIGNNVDFIIDGWSSSFDGDFGTIYQNKQAGIYVRDDTNSDWYKQ